MKHPKDSSFAKSYLALLRALISEPDYICDSRLGVMCEIIGYSFTSPLVTNWELFNKKFPHWNYEYAQYFYDWMMSGSTDMEILARINPSVRKFMPGAEIPDSFSTAYGPRLLSQWDANMAEMAKNNSRRVVFHILQPGDDFLRAIDTKLEYPCCSNIILYKRQWEDITFLDAVASFRSSNAYITMLYDVYNISGFIKAFAESYTEKHGEQIELGFLTFQLGSAHLYDINYQQAINLIQ
jgi:hypothetical protein